MNTKGTSNSGSPKWGRGVFMFALFVGALIVFECGSLLYTEVLYPKKAEKEHKRQVQAAYFDASIADSIAMSLML